MQTIRFLPDRLNAEPVVFRGFTTPEMGLAASMGVGLGLLVSLPFVLLAGWVVIPTGMLIMPLLVIWFGGNRLTRLKRGKPENYIWQRLEHRKRRMGWGNLTLIIDQQSWSLRRSRAVKRSI
ncbi:TIGR03750 family conjugal transfer protein [Pluralibacter gergoviae]|nr:MULTISPECIES: TIGR03750 family conjugal transfer protein [Enterobacterales]EKV9909460.1 TIGR03750 family conjugal transfer protein [Pluralibacter gergoviae]SAQ03310.1 conjugative transfer region protein [Klebsiella oxytoca]HBX4000062.1 TIGR03750 family conjugal transfer protein [Klebsiella variicola]ELD4333514.1 TIGR03750 family conjugal transfer protein [Pluralibacter gergoviae]MBZ6860910.1 TIGR03750 family conjugal transfer protein [Klebsiella michiganensis]